MLVTQEILVSYLHRTLVDFRSIDFQGFVGAVGIAENDGSNATAGSIRAICEISSLDGANRFAEVILSEEGAPISPLVTFKAGVILKADNEKAKQLGHRLRKSKAAAAHKPTDSTQEHQRASSEG